MKCPKCGNEMHTNTHYLLDAKNTKIKYQECGKCGYDNEKEKVKK